MADIRELNQNEQEQVTGGGGYRSMPHERKDYIIHRIGYSDTLERLAREYNTTKNEIVKVNRGMDLSSGLTPRYYIYIPESK